MFFALLHCNMSHLDASDKGNHNRISVQHLTSDNQDDMSHHFNTIHNWFCYLHATEVAHKQDLDRHFNTDG